MAKQPKSQTSQQADMANKQGFKPGYGIEYVFKVIFWQLTDVCLFLICSTEIAKNNRTFKRVNSIKKLFYI